MKAATTRFKTLQESMAGVIQLEAMGEQRAGPPPSLERKQQTGKHFRQKFT